MKQFKIYNKNGKIILTKLLNEKELLSKSFSVQETLDGLVQSGINRDDIDVSKTLSELNKIEFNNVFFNVKSIALIDDDPVALKAMKYSLKQYHHYIETFESVSEAKMVLKKDPERFNLIITDNNVEEPNVGSLWAKESSLPIHIITGCIGELPPDIFDFKNVKSAIAKPINNYTFSQFMTHSYFKKRMAA